MTLHHALHQQADIERLYFKRSEGGRGLTSVEVSVNSEINSLSRYVESCSGPLFEAVYKEEVRDVMLKVVKLHHYSEKEKSALRRNNFMGRLEVHSRSMR